MCDSYADENCPVWDEITHCLRCSAIVDALRPRLAFDNLFTTDTLALDCGEVWEDPPDEIAALAFVLPGEPVTALLGGAP